MLVEKLEEGLLNYRFPLQEGFRYGFNLYVLVSGKSAMLIDSAFRSQTKKVVYDLKQNGLEVTHVIATHFHNDHIAGLMALGDEVVLLGSSEFRETLTKKLPQIVTPVSFSEPIQFGGFTLSFTAVPGHSVCSIAVEIDGKYLHVGDNLMSRYDGKAILPWVQYNQLDNHISSLNLLKTMVKSESVLLLSHGPKVIGKRNISATINDRLRYLQAVKLSEGNCSYKEAIKECSCEFVGEEFFDFLVKKATL